MKIVYSAFVLVGVACVASGSMAPGGVEPYSGAEGWAETKEERLEWFEEARFGMFIHWGLYSAAGGYWPATADQSGQRYDQHYAEWIRYWANVPEPAYGDTARPFFNPEEGCTEAWAELARQAGMRYAVLTTKHHEGYTLFNATAPYSVQNDVTGSTNISPEGRDLVQEFADSMRNEGVRVGFYYSIIDWQHPDAVPQSRPWPLGENPDHSRYVSYMQDHLTQLYTEYGDVDIVWVDYSSDQYQGDTWGTRGLLDMVRENQPHAITNNRFWSGLENDYGDFFTPEKYVPETGFPGRTFEVNHTMNESYGFSYHDEHWKTTEEVIHLLVDIVSKGGNLILNVGPDAQGRVPEACVESLQGVGEWMDVYGDAIYGTEISPFGAVDFDGRCTQKALDNGNTRLYLHVFDRGESGEIVLPGLRNEILSVSMMDSGDDVGYSVDGLNAIIEIPHDLPHDVCSVICVDIEGEADIDMTSRLPQQQADRSVALEASDAEVAGPNIRIEEGEPSNIGYWVTEQDHASFEFVIHTAGRAQAGGNVSHEAGRYQVVVNCAVDANAGGVLRLETNEGEVITAQLNSTGGWRAYQDVVVGEISISETGVASLELTATEIGAAGFANIRQIEIVPID